MQVTQLAIDNPWEPKGPEDSFLMKSDRNPNRRGAEELGLRGDARVLLERVEAGDVQLVYVFWHDLNSREALEALRKADQVIFQGPSWNATAEAADVVLAGATHAEKDGSFTNFEGRIQRFRQAFLPLEDSRNDVDILADLGERLGYRLSDAEEALQRWQNVRLDEMDSFGVLIESGSAAGK
jgi:NADH dehydrogenase/NADH:ubiquinone oxidoreductase subunit G